MAAGVSAMNLAIFSEQGDYRPGVLYINSPKHVDDVLRARLDVKERKEGLVLRRWGVVFTMWQRPCFVVFNIYICGQILSLTNAFLLSHDRNFSRT